MSHQLRQPCLLCTETFLHADTVIAHYKNAHSPSLSTSEAVYGNLCPACGKTFIRLDGHVARRHGRSLALAFDLARRAGDPHAVVAERVRVMLAQTLDEIEQAVAALAPTGFRVAITDDSITLLDGDEELVMWDSAEWMEDPALTLVIANAINVGHTEGPDGVRARLIVS